MAVFCLVTPFSFECGCQTFMRYYHHLGCVGHLLPEDGVTGSSETLATTYCEYTTAFRKPGEVNLTVTFTLFLL
jgi:hypothetical protein